MDVNRAKQIAFQAIQLIRQEAEKAGKDPVDTDDWLFSELDAEVSEILEIFQGYNIPVYTGSCFADNASPKDYAGKRFS